MPKTGTKILGVQYLRGIAALWVVLCHYSLGFEYSYPRLYSVFNFGQNGVEIFFLISGFIIVYSLIIHGYRVSQFFTFIIKRSIRIDPAYIAVIVLMLVLFKVLASMPSFHGRSIPFNPGQFLAHLFYVVPFFKYHFYDSIFWTLCVEFQLYVLIGLSFFLSDAKIYRILFLVVFTGLSFFKWPHSTALVFTYAPIFAAGIALVLYKRERSKLNAALTLFFLALTVINFGWPMCLLLSVCCLVILYCNSRLQVLNFLGNISYSLYLTHTLTFIVVTGITKHMNYNMASNQLLWLLVEVLLAISVAFCFYLLIERPSVRLSKRFFYRK